MNAESTQTRIRQATLADIEFMLGLARRMYPQEPVWLGLPWMIDCIGRMKKGQDRLVLVSGYGIGVASVFYAYGYDKRANMDMLAVEPGHGLHIMGFLRAMVQWGKLQKASVLTIGSTTGVDFLPTVKRLGGGRPRPPTYNIPLGG